VAASWTLPPDVVLEILGRAHNMGVLQDHGAVGSDEVADHDEAIRILSFAEDAADENEEAAEIAKLGEPFRAKQLESPVVTDLLERENFPIPPQLEGDPPEMPRDLTTVGDRHCRRLHSEFNAWLARTNFLLGLERADEAAAEALAEHHERVAYAKLDRLDAGGKSKPGTVLRAEASADTEALEWRRRASEHKQRLVVLYSLRDIYASNVERLRSDWRMRRDEFDMQGGNR
jgi:hypothetical protein